MPVIEWYARGSGPGSDKWMVRETAREAIAAALVLIAWFAADRWLRDYLRQEVPVLPE